MKYFTLFVIFLIAVPASEQAKILGIFPTAAKSHFNIGAALLKGLAKEGHEITIISPFTIPNEGGIKYENVQLTGMEDFFIEKSANRNPFQAMVLPIPLSISFVLNLQLKVCNLTLSHPNVQKLIESGRKFDVVIVEIFGRDSLYGFAQHFDAHLVTVSTFGASKWSNELVGTPAPLSYVPHAFSNYTDKMSFWQRFNNALISLFESLYLNVFYNRKQNALYDKYFPGAKISLDQIRRNGTALVLLNTHFSLSFPRPYMPNMIEIGGIQINRDLKPLPADIKDFLESAKDGVIYFSMGSFIKGTDFSAEQRRVFFNVFSKLKHRIIWKFEDETMPGIPKNIMVKKWLPQNEILAHPNIKIFISHGGLLGTTEAIYSGVPIIGIPVFGDQELNIAKAVAAGFAVRIDKNNITETSLELSIQEIFQNPFYNENAKKISKLYRDQPMTPTETANYWVEYVIRNKGAPHLRSGALDLNFWEYHMLDVFLLMVLIGAVLILSPFFFLFIIWRKRNKLPEDSKEIKQKKTN